MLILEAIWLLLPAGFANMAPIFVARVFPRWDTPVDFGISWNGNKIFGSHKTYRGLMSGTVAGLLIFFIQQSLYRSFPSVRTWSLFNYDEINVFFGAWMGLGALLGDLVKSFFKRRLAIAPGRAWIPFDQVDWIIGGLLSICAIIVPGTVLVIASIAIGLCLHFFIKYIGYLWKLNPTPL